MDTYRQQITIAFNAQFPAWNCDSVTSELRKRLEELCNTNHWAKPKVTWLEEDLVEQTTFGVGSQFTRDHQTYLVVEALGHHNLFNINTGVQYLGEMSPSLETLAARLHTTDENFVLTTSKDRGVTTQWAGDVSF